MEEKVLSSNLTLLEYKEICGILDRLPLPSVSFNREYQIQAIYPHIPLPTIASIVQYHIQSKTKGTHFILKLRADNIYYKFLKGLQQHKVGVAYALALELKQPPYLVSQVILQKHYSKCWEDELVHRRLEFRNRKSEIRDNKVNHEKFKQFETRPAPNNTKRIAPIQVDFERDFPSLKETSVMQKRITPIAVQNAPKPNIMKSPVIQCDKQPRKMNTTPLSLSDVMVVKVKKAKNKDTSVTNDTTSTIVESLIQNKDKNKLFDRILNKPKAKTSDKDKNDNKTDECHISSPPKKAKLKWKKVNVLKANVFETPVKNSNDLNTRDFSVTKGDQRDDVPNTSNKTTLVESSTDNTTRVVPDKQEESSTDNTTRVVPDEQEESSTNNTTRVVPDKLEESSTDNTTRVVPDKQEESSTNNTTRVTPDKLEESSTNNTTRVVPKKLEESSACHHHELSSIHFMTQNCQSKEELYEDYRRKLKLLNQRFTNQLHTPESKLPFQSSENKQRIDKLSERMVKKTERVYLNSLNSAERSNVQATLLSKMKIDEVDSEKNKVQEVFMTEEELAQWKHIVRTYEKSPEALVQHAAEFSKKFNANLKPANGPKEFLKRMLRDPSVIRDPILSHEISYNNAMDDQFGPLIEVYRRSMGVAYEEKLMKHLDECGISYKSEKLCMSLGFDKTPDVLVHPTLFIDGSPVNWIESKALFGNPHNHKQYEANQYMPYFKRYGPGCVIYFFGHVTSLEPRSEYLLRTALPTQDEMKQDPAKAEDLALFLERCSSFIQIEKAKAIEIAKAAEKKGLSKQARKRARKRAQSENGRAQVRGGPDEHYLKARSQSESRLLSGARIEPETGLMLPPIQNFVHTSRRIFEPFTVNLSNFSDSVPFPVAHSSQPNAGFEFPQFISPIVHGNLLNSSQFIPAIVHGNLMNSSQFIPPIVHGNLLNSSQFIPPIVHGNLLNSTQFISPTNYGNIVNCSPFIPPIVNENLVNCSTPIKNSSGTLAPPSFHDYSPDVSFSDISVSDKTLASSNLESSSMLSACSMCDTSLADKTSSTKSSSPCFSSHCADKLLSYTSPCSCKERENNNTYNTSM